MRPRLGKLSKGATDAIESEWDFPAMRFYRRNLPMGLTATTSVQNRRFERSVAPTFGPRLLA